MKKLLLTIALIFAVTSIAVASEQTGNPGDTLSQTHDILLTIPTNYTFTVVSLQVDPTLLPDPSAYSADLLGVLDFGALLPDPLEDPADNPYGTGPRLGASHYMDVRFYVTNNTDPYSVTMTATGSVYQLPASAGSDIGTIFHFGTDAANPDTPTANPANLNLQIGDGSYGIDGLFSMEEDTTYTLYDTGAGSIQSDQFIALIFLDNVSPNYDAQAVGTGDVGDITYSMIPHA